MEGIRLINAVELLQTVKNINRKLRGAWFIPDVLAVIEAAPTCAPSWAAYQGVYEDTRPKLSAGEAVRIGHAFRAYCRNHKCKVPTNQELMSILLQEVPGCTELTTLAMLEMTGRDPNGKDWRRVAPFKEWLNLREEIK